ncbi:hypothetical protein L484_021406 [Morus notabilis]|uniref:Uncharacterized protein n=1 Tax=Morus notabilis TaxID=981085 RepID=W9RT13_9ROSA|nr:hypothetical protein L484_021406 [Morus notabilis]
MAAGKKTEEKSESMEKEMQQIMASLEKGIDEVRAEMSQNMADLRRFMEEQLWLLTAQAMTGSRAEGSGTVAVGVRDGCGVGVREGYDTQAMGERRELVGQVEEFEHNLGNRSNLGFSLVKDVVSCVESAAVLIRSVEFFCAERSELRFLGLMKDSAWVLFGKRVTRRRRVDSNREWMDVLKDSRPASLFAEVDGEFLEGEQRGRRGSLTGDFRDMEWVYPRIWRATMGSCQSCGGRIIGHRFEVSAAPLHDVPEEILEGIFVNGLKAEIRAELRLLKPAGLTEIMDTTQRIEEKNMLL